MNLGGRVDALRPFEHCREFRDDDTQTFPMEVIAHGGFPGFFLITRLMFPKAELLGSMKTGG